MKKLIWKEGKATDGNYTLTVKQVKKGRWDYQVHQDQPTKSRTSTVHTLIADGSGRSSKEAKNLAGAAALDKLQKKTELV